MKLKTPMRAINKNLLLTRAGDVWAYYRIKSNSIPMQNKEKVNVYKKKWQHLFEEITSYEDFHLMMYPSEYELDKRFKELESDIAEDALDVARYYNEETIRLLEQRLERLTKYDFIFGVKLKNSLVNMSMEIKDNILSLFNTATDTVVKMLGWEQNVSTSFFKQYEEVEDNLANIMTSVRGERLSENEMVYINRYHFVRGLNHHTKEESEIRKVDSITNTLIDPTNPSVLNLHSDRDEGFVSFVVIDEFLHNMAESDLFYETQSLPFPVEVQMKVQAESKSITKPSLNIKKQQLKEEQLEQQSTGDRSDVSTVTSATLVRHLQDEIKKEEVSLMNWLAVIVVHGDTKKECVRKATIVRRHLKGAGITCRFPVADQLNLFYKMLPGEKLDITDKNWIQKTTQDGLAECLFAINSDIGSKIGFFLGWIDRFMEHTDLENAIYSSRDFVLYHPFLANQYLKGSKTRSPHCLITGDTGNGKSYLAKLIFIYVTFLKIKSLYIDPKKEMRKWIQRVLNDQYIIENFPLYVAHLEKFHYITLDHENENNWGALDPICFLPPMKAKELVQVIFEQVYDFKGKDDVNTAFLRATSNVIERKQRGEQVGSLHIIKEMQGENQEPAVRKAGDYLNEVVSDSILKLCIHDGSNPALSLDERITILEVENLDLPEHSERIENYTISQLKSSAVMFALGKFCELFGMNPDEQTVEFIDEAWIFTTSQQGKKVERQMRRIGRSYNNAEFFISQSTKDALKEEDSGNFGVAFAFDEPNEREEVLKWMNMEVTKENEKMLGSMFQGQCLFKDYYGRTSKISIECLFEEWQGALKTVEKKAVAYAEEKYL
ncbi:ATP-binding protein [Bacillus paralicheniformis]|uniref:ATP-binding protein n=1 Tax=Bacillus paralicheniformis TaxID=1648923 RepID=UPI002DBAE8EC|nr:ATP-binding protein [Bacillus paralicheniformis]MEC1053550.1 ATP-binding protein [Bacillus paralicheniformis]MEC1088542.1 ATP-binding protein [Bacillus paralicheniformis]MEC1104892.1 ATP-binding protein [Bacillus paralicheniformis]MEC1112141.1 ATP-binding protein [Bacillus paralicheniformis]MEC1141163.1 ATP-binding protein [Bacillus paralicheniformis]